MKTDIWTRAYIGTYTDEKLEGIHIVEANSATGAITGGSVGELKPPLSGISATDRCYMRKGAGTWPRDFWCGLAIWIASGEPRTRGGGRRGDGPVI